MNITSHAPETECLALASADVAKLLQVSERHISSLNSSGRLPRPIKLGRSVRWNAAELKRWLDAGAPSRDEWEAMKTEIE